MIDTNRLCSSLGKVQFLSIGIILIIDDISARLIDQRLESRDIIVCIVVVVQMIELDIRDNSDMGTICQKGAFIFTRFDSEVG